MIQLRPLQSVALSPRRRRDDVARPILELEARGARIVCRSATFEDRLSFMADSPFKRFRWQSESGLARYRSKLDQFRSAGASNKYS